MTKKELNRKLSKKGLTLNGLVQALHRLGIPRREIFSLCDLPYDLTTHNCGWYEVFNVKPWSERSLVEQQRLLAFAGRLYLSSSVRRYIRLIPMPF